ncbi:UNVERIFIED_CONTAM: hypothetical protein GTU68_018491 [Idotea baltica]|nr:hypothetical protein [Idotea baltica]
MADLVLSVQGISKRFGALQACDDVSLDVQQGEIHALIGPNGAGKSTLIAQIAGALKPDAGHVFLHQEDITTLGTADRAKKGLARTFQISSLAMEDSVLQNVMLGAVGAHGSAFRFFRHVLGQNDLRDRAITALEEAGLADFAQSQVSALSHGQRRQVEIAIALAMDPKVFVMDEPMAGLGAAGSTQLTGLLSDLRHRAPILLVEHDMDAVFALADRISVLVYGEIIATGTVDEIRNNQSNQALFGVNLEVQPGEALALLGRNGMGKTTTIKTICRMLPLTSGKIIFDGHDLGPKPSHHAAQLGLGLVPEGRRCFRTLTVTENLIAAARPGYWTQARVSDLFPRLAERAQQIAGQLSGGEQQMLAIGRALMTNPTLLLLDEATEGLAPVVRQEIWAAITHVRQETGLALLVVDKSMKEMSALCEHAVILDKGRSVWTGFFKDLDVETTHRYLGV